MTKTVAKPLSKTAAARQKSLRHEVILATASAATPVIKKAQPGPAQKPKKPAAANGKQLAVSSQKRKQPKRSAPAGAYDIWDAPPPANTSAELVPAIQKVAPVTRRAQHKVPIPAVEVDAAGCSFNPDQQLHAEAISKAVNDELRKLQAKVG